MTFSQRIISASITLLATIFVVAADDASIDKLLKQFDQTQGGAAVATAYQLMHIFKDNEITEQLIQFAPQTPLDSLRQQVWYWTSEYYYDRAQVQAAAAKGWVFKEYDAQGTLHDITTFYPEGDINCETVSM